MFFFTDYEKYQNDIFNQNQKRNIRNADKTAYNCGGYALKCFSWYCPQHNAQYWDNHKLIFNEMVESILKDFPNLRKITKKQALSIKKEIIAFRLDYKGYDFHFLRRARNGCWYNKRGSSHYISTITKEEVFSKSWFGRYTGRTAFFVEE